MPTASNHVFSWTENGGMVDLGTLGGDDGRAYAVNNRGQVVGYSSTTAVLWEPSGSGT